MSLFSINARSQKELRHFGLILGLVVPTLFGLTPIFLGHQPYRLWPWIFGAVMCLLAMLRPQLLSAPYMLWMKIGGVLGWINTRVILAIVYCLIIIPLGLVMQLLGNLRFTMHLSQDCSYRIVEKAQPKEGYKRIF